jgi:hypothetical protein
MKFFYHHYILLIVLTILGFLVFAGAAVLEAWLDTRKRPKEAMYWCGTHGFIRKRHCLPLFPGMKKQNGEDFVVCPMCFRDGVFKGQDAGGIKLG